MCRSIVLKLLPLPYWFDQWEARWILRGGTICNFLVLWTCETLSEELYKRNFSYEKENVSYLIYSLFSTSIRNSFCFLLATTIAWIKKYHADFFLHFIPVTSSPECLQQCLFLLQALPRHQHERKPKERVKRTMNNILRTSSLSTFGW